MGLHINMKKLLIAIYVFMVSMDIVFAEIRNDGKTFGSCVIFRCMLDSGQAQYCCGSGRNKRCCSYYGGGGGWNNGNNGGYNNNKPGTCPPYDGRYKRSPVPQDANGGRHFGGGGGNNGWNNGGGGYGGRCIRDSECPGSLKCCYLY